MARRGVSGLLLLLVCAAAAAAATADTTTTVADTTAVVTAEAVVEPTKQPKCPERRTSGSPGREVVCYTGTANATLLLEAAVCHCTSIVHQGHDLTTLDASELKAFRDKAREANPEVRVIMSVSDEQSLLKGSASARQEAATKLTDALKEVDGVELNVTAGSKDRLVSFVKGLREEMANRSAERMVLLALPTRPELLAKQFELKELSKYVDLFTIATHYLHNANEAYRTFHPSRLMGLFDMLNTDSLVDLISGMGAPKHKILISAPVSAYNFTLKKLEDNMPWSSTVEELPTPIDRKKLCDAMNDGEWTVERDEDLTAPYAFKNSSWIAFEDETSLKIKGKYVILRDLAGLGLRDIENDVNNDCGGFFAKLVRESFTEMKRKTRDVVLSSLEKDLKETEISYPRHVRSSDFRIVRVVDTEGKIRAVRENTQTSFTCTRQGYFVHPRSCNRFYRCVKFNQEVDDYSVFEFDCPAGLAFDERTEVCSWPGSLSTGSACPGSSEIEPVPRSRFRCPHQPGFYSDPQNCRWFFACYDLGGPEMVPYEFRCPFGLVFDQQKLVCEWPWKVPGCEGPKNGHSVYAYGSNYGGTDEIPQGGIIGQGGFIGRPGYNGQEVNGFDVFNQGAQGINSGVDTFGDQGFNYAQGSNYDNTAYDTAGSNFNGQTYNIAGGADYDGQFFNSEGAGTAFGQNYNAADAGRPFTEQTYNAASAGPGYAGQTYNAASARPPYAGQTYNSADSTVLNVGPGYNPDVFNDAGELYAGQNYNSANIGQTFNSAGASNAGQTYVSPVAGQPYNSAGASISAGQPYNSAGASYAGQTYNSAGSARPSVPQTYNNPGVKQPTAGQTFNTANAGQTYNSPQTGRPIPQTYNTPGVKGPYAGKTNNAATTGQTYNTAETVVQGENYNSDGASDFRANDGYHYDKPVKEFHEGFQTTLGNDVQKLNTNIFNSATTGLATDLNDYDDQRGATSNSPFNGPTTYQGNGEIKTTQFSADTSATSLGVNNLAGNNVPTTGFTDSQTNLGGATVYNAGTSGYATGSTNQFNAGTVTGYKADTVGNTNSNDITNLSTGQNGITGGFSTIGFGNTAEAFGTQNTQFNDVEGLTVYNASYNPTAGFPSSTIVPFSNTQNNGFDNTVYQGPNTVNFGGSTVGASNYNTIGGSTNTQENNQFIGSSISTANNDITQFRESTNTPDNFRLNGNTATNTQFNTGTAFNQGTTLNQNSYNNYAGDSTINSVTPSSQNYNNEATFVPGVQPLNNNARPQVELDNSGLFGGPTAGGNSVTTQDAGYRTNEYYDNGGRGTIRYNNGVVTNKVTDNDIQDYRTSTYTRIPNSFIINAGNGENPQSTIVKADSTNTQLFTKEGFTKTGPTKTGITTAQVGGSGSYVIGNGQPRPRPNPQYIGENAFTGTYGNTDSVNKFGTQTTSNIATGGSTQYSKPNTEFQGYSYPKPLVQLEINSGLSTPRPTQTNFVSTTPSAISNIQTLDNQNSIVIDSAQDEGFSSTISPVGFTTGQKEDFRTTVYQAAKVPQVVSTVRPVIDTGSRTVISSTPVPAIYSTPAPAVYSTPAPAVYNTPTENAIPTQKTYLDVGVSFDDYSLSGGSTGFSDYSDVTSNFDQGNFGQKISDQPRVTNTNYQQPTTTNLKEENQNTNNIISTQEDYSNYATGVETTQNDLARNNQATNFGPTVTVPKQVYIPSSTIAPPVGVTFRQPIPAAELPQNPANQPTGFSLNINTGNAATRGSFNRNQGTVKLNHGILINQAPAEFAYQGPSNRVLPNQASTSYSSQSANQYFGNQATGNFAPREQNIRINNHQDQSNFAYQEQSNGVYGTRAQASGFSRNQASANSYSSPNQGVSGQTRTLVGSSVVTSIDLNNEVSRQNGDSLKIITEFNNGNLGRLQSTTLAPEVTTFTGDYSRSRTQSSVNQNKKVVVKLSDLHPLILNKLGAECTCKSDPFAVFRGPNRQSLPINSQNRGPIDLANYDEKDIFVDVDSDKENAEEIDFAKNIPSNRLIKNPNLRVGEQGRRVVVSSRGEPSSTFLPPTASPASSTYLPPSSTYLPSTTAAPLRNQARSQNRQPVLIRVDDNFNSASIVRSRSGKALQGSGTANDLRNKNGPTLKSTDEPLDGSLQCARPGLFRHPKLCNKFYACHWDEWKKRYTLHVFNCPVHLAFDASAGACNYPSKGPACQDNKLLI